MSRSDTASEQILTGESLPFEALLDSIPNRIYYVDAGGRFRYANKEYVKFSGRELSYLIGKTGAEAFRPETWAVLEPLGKRALAGEIVRWEGWLTFDSGLRYTQRIYRPHRTGNGKIAGFFVFVRDLTEQKNYQRDLETSLELTRESEGLKAAIIDSALDSVIVIDEDARVVSFNPMAERTFGYVEREIIGRPIGELIVPPDLRAQHDAGMRRYLATGHANVLGRRVEISAMRADGSIFPVELAITEVNARSKRLFTAYLRDLTEQRAATAEIERQREALHQSEKLAALGSMLAGVAHELNNPLAVVIGQSLMLEEDASAKALGPIREKIAERAGKIKRAAERCARIVRTFLMMARQQKAQRQEVALDQLVTDAIELLNYGLRTSGIEVQCDFDQSLPAITADSDQVHQVLVNLLINAQQALNDTPLPRRINVTVRHDADRHEVVATVSDNGPGVPAGVSSRIFDPFFTTKPIGMGTGVGLAVSRGVVEAHGGRLTLLDHGSVGATFELRLPVGDGSGVSATNAEAERHQEFAQTKHRRMLIIDDEPEIAAMLQEILLRDGFVSDIAGSGSEARAFVTQCVGSDGYDAILCDLRMGDEDGPTFFRWLQQARPEMVNRLAFVTGDTLSAGASHFISECRRPVIDKPFVPSEVRRQVSLLVRGEVANSA